MTDIIRVVSLADSALDLAAMGARYSEYVRSRDAALVREIPGARATWFHLRRIPTTIFNRVVQAGATEIERYQRAFQCAVVSVHNYPGEHGPEMLRPTGKIQSGAGVQLDAWTDAEVDMLHPVFVAEIGWLAWDRSFLVPGSAAHSPVPRLLLHVLAMRTEEARQAAARASTEPAPSSSPPSGAPEETPSAAQSDEPGAATATG